MTQRRRKVARAIVHKVIKRSWMNEKQKPVLTSACLFVGDWLRRISVESLFAVMAMSSGCIVSTIHTNSTRNTTRKLVQLQIETTASGMSVAVAGWNGNKSEEEMNTNVFDLKWNWKKCALGKLKCLVRLARMRRKLATRRESHQFCNRQFPLLLQDVSVTVVCSARNSTRYERQ